MAQHSRVKPFLNFLDNSALLGGVLRVTASSITLSGSYFLYNLAFYSGVLELDNAATLTAKNVNFQYNTAYSQTGVINVVTKSHFYIDSCYFEYNYADQVSTINVLDSGEVRLNIYHLAKHPDSN